MPFTSWFKDSVVKDITNTTKGTLGSDPTAKAPDLEPLGSVTPKDISGVGEGTASLWHDKGSKS